MATASKQCLSIAMNNFPPHGIMCSGDRNLTPKPKITSKVAANYRFQVNWKRWRPEYMCNVFENFETIPCVQMTVNYGPEWNASILRLSCFQYDRKSIMQKPNSRKCLIWQWASSNGKSPHNPIYDTFETKVNDQLISYSTCSSHRHSKRPINNVNTPN